MAKYLLIVSCSKRKTPMDGPRPAIEVYDGPVYRAMRKRQGCLDLSSVDIRIISAKHGLIRGDTPIEHYDHRMTSQRARELQDVVLAQIGKQLKERNYNEVFVNLGSAYSVAIRGVEGVVPEGTKLLFARGGIGERTSQTIGWLEHVASKDSNHWRAG